MKKLIYFLSLLIIFSLFLSCGKSDVEIQAEEFCTKLDTLNTMMDIEKIPVLISEMGIINLVIGFDEDDEKKFKKLIKPCIEKTKKRIANTEGRRIAIIDYETILSKASDSTDFEKKLSALKKVNKSWEEITGFKNAYEKTLDSILDKNKKYKMWINQ
jgi:hypothetical protein